VAPYNAELGLYLRRWLGRPETIAAVKTILEAEKFALRTPDGKVRAALAARDDATPSLALYDGDGTARAGLELGADGQANLWFAGKDGQVTVSLNPRNLRMTDAEGAVFVTRTALVLADRKQRNRVTLGVKPDGSPSLTLADKEGRTGALVDVVDDGSRLGSSTTAWCAPASASAPAARSSTSTARTARTTRRSAWRPTARPVSSSTARTASSAPRSAWLRTTPRASRSSTRVGASAPR